MKIVECFGKNCQHTSPVIENTPHTFAFMHAAAKISVSGPGIVDAVSIISLWSYMIPCVEYSGKMTKSMPGNPDCKSKSVSHVLKRDD